MLLNKRLIFLVDLNFLYRHHYYKLPDKITYPFGWN